MPAYDTLIPYGLAAAGFWGDVDGRVDLQEHVGVTGSGITVGLAASPTALPFIWGDDRPCEP